MFYFFFLSKSTTKQKEAYFVYPHHHFVLGRKMPETVGLIFIISKQVITL